MPRVTQAQALALEVEQEALCFFEQTLSQLPDPRRAHGIRYPLRTVVVTALMSMICGAEDAQGMQLWGEANGDWLEGILEMPHGAPTQDVYLSVFASLNPKAFSEVFLSWASLLCLRLKMPDSPHPHIAIDGKTSRRSYDPANGKMAIHTVSAWASEMGLVLAQIKTGEKSNEITAIPELLKVLDIRGTTVTIDAMGCQREIACAIVEKSGNYLLSVKENQPILHHDLETAFEYAGKSGAQSAFAELSPAVIETAVEVDKGHGRIERRTIQMSRDLSWITSEEKWKGLSFFAKITRERTVLKTGKTSVESAFYIGSHATMTAEEVAKKIRRHWSIENELHWVLDMAFREDEARHRAKNAAQNMTTLRHFALNIIKQDKNRKLGVANSRKRAGWDRGYLIKLLINLAG